MNIILCNEENERKTKTNKLNIARNFQNKYLVAIRKTSC